MKVMYTFLMLVLFSSLVVSCNKSEDSKGETNTEAMKELGNDAKREAKETMRDAKDETCEMVNGKMECAAQKVKHSIQNGADAVEDAVD